MDQEAAKATAQRFIWNVTGELLLTYKLKVTNWKL